MKTILKLVVLALLLPMQGLSQIPEQVEVSGGITLGSHVGSPPAPGTVEFDGVSARVFDGVQWWPLDLKGIVSMPNQSCGRIFQSWPQQIPAGIWTPLQFDVTLFDVRGDFTTSPQASPSPPNFNEEAYFKAPANGKYAVHARVEFNLDSSLFYQQTTLLDPKSYVSIAICKSPAPPGPPGTQSLAELYAQGNNLQIAVDALGPPSFIVGMNGEFIVPGMPDGQGDPLLNRNNAPNVSAVVDLVKDETVSIWVLYYNPAGSGAGPQFLWTQPFHIPGQEDPTPELAAPMANIPHEGKIYFDVVKVN